MFPLFLFLIMPSSNILDHYGKTHSGFLHSYGEVATELLIEGLSIRPGENILEIGLGTGATLVKIASRFPGANYFGIELSDQMLEKARSRIRFCSLENKIRLQKINSVEELNVFNSKMDKIYIESVLGIQEDNDLKKMILKISGLLNPQGKLVVNETIWTEDVAKEEIERVNSACKNAFGIIQSNGKYNNQQKWNELFAECGFKIVSSGEINTKGKEKRRSNLTEWKSAVFTKLGKLKGELNRKLKTETGLFQNSMDSIITSKKQIMKGYLFVLEKM
jgi:cyclopropane fatty-acyl-phospholipid synthase-like methyltransferase